MAEEVRVLLELVGGDLPLAREILADFLKSDATDRAGLAAAAAEQRNGDIAHYAHRIKGAARAVGANQHATTAGEIELCAAIGEPLDARLAALEESAAAIAGWERLLHDGTH